MQDVIVSLNGNVLKVTALNKGELKTVTKEVTNESVKDSIILDSHKFSETLGEVFTQLNITSKSNYQLSFIVEPEDMFFKFVTVNKSDEDLETKIVNEVKDKLGGSDINDLYYSYKKIAPFVYQFIAIKRDYLEKYLEVSSFLGAQLVSVLPWVLLLPKYVGTNDSSIFVCNVGVNPVVVLSELGGVYFVGSYDENETPEKLGKLVAELSVYNRSTPIKMVYTFNYNQFGPVDGLNIRPIEIPSSANNSVKGYDANLLANYMLDLDPDTLSSQLNLLNLLPLPTVDRKPMSLSKVGVPAGAVLLAVLIFGGFMFFNRNGNNSQNLDVLGEGNTVSENQPTPTPQPTPVEQPKKELDKSDLVIRVENGSGVNGMAAAAKTKLESLGYKVLEIDTADESRDSTLFKFKNTKMDYKDLILKDTAEFLPTTEVEDGVETDEAYDLLIIVGSTQEL